MAQDKKSSDEILKELFNSIHDIAPSSEDEGGSDVDKKVVVKKEKKSKSSYDSSYCSKSKHKKKKKSKKSSTKYSLHISSGSDKKSKNKKSSSKSFSDSGRRKEKSKIKVEKELDLIEVLKKEVIDSVPCSVISAPESIDLPPLPPVGNVFIKQEPASPKKPPVKDDDVFKEPGQPILSDEAVDVKPGETSPGDGTKEDCDDETISRVADVFEEDLLESGDKLQTKGLLISEKPKKTIQIQNLKNSSVLEDAAKSKAKSDELKMKKKRKQEEGELTDDLSDISSSSDSELDSTDDGGEASRTTSKLSDDQKKEDRRKEEKDKDRSKKKKKKDKHRRKSHTREDGSRRRSERKSRRSGDPVKVERSSRRRSQSRSRIGSAPSNRRSLSHHMEVGRHRERRWGSRSRSRSLNRGHRRSQSPRSKRRRNSREPDDLRSKLKRKKSSEREQSGDQRNRSKGSPERSRARLEKDEYYIDKGKLLEIARKNALSMLRQGQVGGDMNKVVHITAGGKTVDELTDFCKHLSRKDATGMESVSSDSSSDESEKPFHHPFKLKERPSQIIMNIRNCVPLPPKTHQEKATENLRIQFPVSSGQLHRKTESEWVPVPPKKTETKPQPSTSKPKETTAPLAIEAPPVVAGPVVPKYPTVYPTPAEKRAVDIGAVISERLAAIRKDFDTSGSSVFGSSRSWEAPHTTGLFTGSTGAKVLTPTELASGQQAWARKDQLMSAAPVSGGMGMSLLQKMGWKPGEGLGKNHEGSLEPLKLPVKMDKKDAGCRTRPYLYRRLVFIYKFFLGYKVVYPGDVHDEGLVHDEGGVLDDCLVCAEEMSWRQRQQQGRIGPVRPFAAAVKAMEGKHPVSLLNEFCTRRKYRPPEFHTVKEDGPPHQKRFIIKVSVNGVDYQPSITSSTKKLAKSEAAKVCLRSMGVLSNS